jgi:hypothetical protein
MTDYRMVPYAGLVLRLSLAGLFIAHLYRKFAIQGLDNWWLAEGGLFRLGFFTTLAAAALLLFGIYSRYVSLYALPTDDCRHAVLGRAQGLLVHGRGIRVPARVVHHACRASAAR